MTMLHDARPPIPDVDDGPLAPPQLQRAYHLQPTAMPATSPPPPAISNDDNAPTLALANGTTFSSHQR